MSNQPVPSFSPTYDWLSLPEAGRSVIIDFNLPRQTGHRSCGATCLDQILRYHGLHNTGPSNPKTLANGGTMLGWLGTVALERGLHGRLLTLDNKSLDPTWLRSGRLSLDQAQAAVKTTTHDRAQLQSYIDFTIASGIVEPITPWRWPNIGALLLNYGPLLVGLSQTFLGQGERTTPADNVNTVNGRPIGHFVVVRGFVPAQEGAEAKVCIEDPWGMPNSSEVDPNRPEDCLQSYELPLSMFWAAVGLSIHTNDAGILALRRFPQRH